MKSGVKVFLQATATCRPSSSELHTMQTKKAGQHWVKRGFAPEEVCPCLEARCPFPCKAAEPGDKGITLDMATEHYGYDEDDFPMTPGEAYRAGVMNEDSFYFLSPKINADI